MKKMKKLFAVILSLAMVLGMSITSFAAKTGSTLTVTNLATNATQEVSIYEIYKLDDNDNSWVAAEWTKSVENLSPDKLNDETVLAKLKKATAYTTATAKDTTETAGPGFVKFTNLQAGAYLVLVNDTSNNTTYSTMVATTYKYDESTNLITTLDASVVAKAETYHVTKDVDKATAEVGELVTYKVKTVVPYQSKDADGSKKVTEFKITDTLTNATFYVKGKDVKDASPVLTFTVNGVTNEELKPSADTLQGGSTFELNLMSLVTDDNTYAGQEVVLTYTAMVGKENTVDNKATSSQDPNGTTTYTYNGNATITKKDDDKSDPKNLEGAQFAVYKIVDNKKYYASIDEKGWFDGTWTEEENGALPKAAGTITTKADGTATVKGLTVGTYYFKEVVAPDGYSINTEDVEFEMVEKKDEGSNTVTGVEAKDSASIEMLDTKLSSLPSTGGIGTTIFTIAGCAIMIAAAGLFFASRKKSDNK